MEPSRPRAPCESGVCHLVELISFLARHGQRTSEAEHVFLDDDGRETKQTVGKIWTRSGGVARELRRWGAAKGDRVLFGENDLFPWL